MGTTQCCSGTEVNQATDLYQYEFGQDNIQPQIQHPDSITVSDQSCNIFLLDCQARLRNSSKLYQDPTLKYTPLILKSQNQEDEIKCNFLRPYRFLTNKSVGKGSKYKILTEGKSHYTDIVIKNDALQYFSVFLCFLADHPHLIQEIILTEANTYGIHVINMYIHLAHRPIFIDDYILCNNKKPVFSQPVNGVFMWPCLLEKAWLKVKESLGQKKILTSSPIQVFQHFLSYQLSTYSLSSLQNTFRDIVKNQLLFKKGNYFIVTSKKQPHHKIGLSGTRHYYLKHSFEFQGKTHFYLRNPCGLFDFRGFHITISSQLQKKIRQQTGELQIAEGNFILQQEQFFQQIEQLLVVHYNQNSNVISERLIKSNINEDIYVQMMLEHEEEVSISFVQEQMEGGFPFCQVTYQVISDQENALISGRINEDACFGMRSTNLLKNIYQKLPAGKYLIRIKKKLSYSAQSHFQNKPCQPNDKIVITGSRKVQIDSSIPQACHSKFELFLMEYGRSEMGRVFNGSHYRDKDIEHEAIWLGDLVFIYIRKRNKAKAKINLEVNFFDKINLECISHFLNSQFTVIPLTQQAVIVFEKIDLTEETSLGKYIIETF